jgi:hypothetical protein
LIRTRIRRGYGSSAINAAVAIAAGERS